MTLWQAVKILKRRWWLIGLITGIVTGAVFAYFWSQPREFEGFMTVAEFRSIIANRTVIYPDPYSLQVDLITRLQNVANVIGSYTVLMSTWRELKDSGQWDPAEQIKRQVSLNEQDYAGVINLANRLEIKPLPNTEYLRVTLRVQGDIDRAPAQARYAMEVLLRKFQEQYQAINTQTARPSREFVQQQYEDAQREYERAARQLSEYLNQNKDVIQADNQTNILLQNIARAETQLFDAERAQKEAYTRMAQVSQQLKQEASRPGGGAYKELSKVVRTNPILQKLQSDLASAENELQGLLLQYGENWPEVKRLKGRVDDLKAQISQEQRMILDAQTTGVNNLYEALQRDYLQAVVDAQTADKRVAELRTQLQQLKERLNGLPDRQRTFEQLRLNVQLAQAKVQLMKNKLDEAIAREAETQTAGQIKLIDAPGAQPVDKQIPLKVALAFALSLILSTGLVLLMGQVDQGVYTPSQAEALFGIPAVAALPRMRRALLARDRAEQTPLSASYQLLSTSLMDANGRLKGPAVAITGADPDVGRTTVAYNLALTLARDGARVVLIDADMRQPSLHRLLRTDASHPGLSELLQGQISLEQAVQQTPIEGLVFIGAGMPPENPVRLLRSPQLQELLNTLAKVADFIVVDTPAGATFADGTVIGLATGNVLIVHAAGNAMNESTREMLARFKQAGINMVGVVLNKVRLDDSVVYQHFQRAYRQALETRNGSAGRAALPPSSRSEDAESEQTAPRD
jgi:capsular exopolysaccharide synthesis family protein